MKTLEEIKREYAQERGFMGLWHMEYEGMLGSRDVGEVAKRYAKEVARKALKNAADKSQEMMYYVIDEVDDNIEGLLRLKRRTFQPCYAVPKQTVLSESNIPEL